jgi:uncharacterized protein
MRAEQATLIGRVRHVLGARITVELAETVAGTSPLLGGKLHRIGQIGSVLRIPQGTIDLLATVTMVGISELSGVQEPGTLPTQGDRWLWAQLLGERDSLGLFHRGVSRYPALDDAVHLTTDADLNGVYPAASDGLVRIGTLSTADHELCLDVGKLVMRHTAVVGSTGSGKSSTVARLLQNIVDAGYGRANIVIVDPHGEYPSAFGDKATVRSVLETDPAKALWVPYWALGPEDLMRIYVGTRSQDSPTVKNRFFQEILDARQRFLRESKWSAPAPEDVSSESPVPFDLRQVWYNIDHLDRATYATGKSQGAVCEEKKGDPAKLQGAVFKEYRPSGPFQGNTFGQFRSATERIKARMLDPLYGFLEREKTATGPTDPLPGVISKWLGDDRPISILDFSGVPAEASDIAIGAVINLLFQCALASPRTMGVGRNRPIFLVLEEAHRFIRADASKGDFSSGLARLAAERISREGRKYGIGLMLVTQRPSELSDTVLSQCGTIVAHRLSNSRDQSNVESALPDSVAQIAQVLPSLRTGEVIVTGEAVALPSRAMIDRPSPEPRAADPPIDSWKGAPEQNELASAVQVLRGGDTSGD